MPAIKSRGVRRTKQTHKPLIENGYLENNHAKLQGYLTVGSETMNWFTVPRASFRRVACGDEKNCKCKRVKLRHSSQRLNTEYPQGSKTTILSFSYMTYNWELLKLNPDFDIALNKRHFHCSTAWTTAIQTQQNVPVDGMGKNLQQSWQKDIDGSIRQSRNIRIQFHRHIFTNLQFIVRYKWKL